MGPVEDGSAGQQQRNACHCRQQEQMVHPDGICITSEPEAIKGETQDPVWKREDRQEMGPLWSSDQRGVSNRPASVARTNQMAEKLNKGKHTQPAACEADIKAASHQISVRQDQPCLTMSGDASSKANCASICTVRGGESRLMRFFQESLKIKPEENPHQIGLLWPPRTRPAVGSRSEAHGGDPASWWRDWHHREHAGHLKASSLAPH